MPPVPPPALILAGGRSSRMGRDKGLTMLGSGTILGHVINRLRPQVSELSLNAPLDYQNPHGLRLVPDVTTGQQGPLSGVLSGLKDLKRLNMTATHLLTVPLDSPFFPLDLATTLQSHAKDQDVIAVACSGGRQHPAFALWPTSIEEDLEARLREPENRRVLTFLERHRMVTVEFPLVRTSAGMLDPFFNINTPEDLDEARRFVKELA